jgi:hypothetical protein
MKSQTHMTLWRNETCDAGQGNWMVKPLGFVFFLAAKDMKHLEIDWTQRILGTIL